MKEDQCSHKIEKNGSLLSKLQDIEADGDIHALDTDAFDMSQSEETGPCGAES